MCARGGSAAAPRQVAIGRRQAEVEDADRVEELPQLQRALRAEEHEAEFWIDEAERFRNQVVEILGTGEGEIMSTKTARVKWRERAIEAERLAAAHFERISELMDKLRQAAADLAEAKEELEQDEIDFVVKDAELDSWVEQADHYRNKLLDRWTNDARYHAEQERTAAADKPGSMTSAKPAMQERPQ
jgi:hypothetical protein